MSVAPMDTWPDLRFVVRPLPWTWRLVPRVYADDPYPWSYATFHWLFLTIEWHAEDRPRWWFRETAESAEHNHRRMGTLRSARNEPVAPSGSTYAREASS